MAITYIDATTNVDVSGADIQSENLIVYFGVFDANGFSNPTDFTEVARLVRH